MEERKSMKTRDNFALWNKQGLRFIGIKAMLRMYLLQICFNLSDEGIKDSIYDSYAGIH